MCPESKPWLRQRGESSRVYRYFEVYRDLGPERSLEKVRQEFGKRSVNISLRRLERLSVRYHWVERAAAWDDYQARLLAEQRTREYQERQMRLAAYGRYLQEKAMQAARRVPLEKLTPQDVLRWLEYGVQLEQAHSPAPPSAESDDYWQNPVVWRLVDALEERLP